MSVIHYAFNHERFALCGWDGHGGVIYDEADSTLYEVSESAFHLLAHLQQVPQATAYMALAAVFDEAPEPHEVQLAEQLLSQFVSLQTLRLVSQ